MHPYSVRLVLVISLDGRLALPKGGASHLGGVGDRKVLEEALAWSDGVLIGGRTLSAHRNTCLIHNRDLIKERLNSGKPEQPIALVISKGEDHSANWPFFQQPIQRWLLSKKVSPNKETKDSRSPAGYENYLQLANNWAQTLTDLSQQGISKLALLGGSQLIASFLKQDLIDDLQLTLSPRITGGSHVWVPLNMLDLPIDLASQEAWKLQATENLGNNELMLRYTRNRSNKINN